MALTSTITIPLATVQNEYQINAQVNVANSGLSDIILLRIVPRIRETSNPFINNATSRTKTHVDISQNPTVPAGSSQNYLMKVIIHAPSGSGTYDLGCDVYASDGQLISPSAVTVTVTNPR